MSRTAPLEKGRLGRADLTLLGILLVAAALRLPGLATDFWLDEIWTLKMVEQRMDAAFDVFTSIRHSNNHHLNTLYFYWLGEQEQWSLYRLPAMLTGICSIWLAFRIAARAGRLEGLLAASLCAASYLLIHFSSEARGYAPVIFFSLLCFHALQLFHETPRKTLALLFGLSACTGFLSHLMFLHTFIAAFLWIAVAELRRGAPLRGAALRLLQLFLPAAVFVLWLYFLDIGATKIGDGPELDAWEVLIRALSYAFGGPTGGPIAICAALVTLCCWGGATLWLARRGRDEWVFFFTVIFASPAASFVILRPELFFVRYFLLGTTFGFVALAYPLAQAWRAGGAWRMGLGVFLAAVLAGNALLVARFYRDGRGGYLETMQHIAETTDVAPTVAGDHRFRTGNVIRFYNRYLPANQQLILVDQKQSPEWLLLHRIGPLGPVAGTLAGPGGDQYELDHTARYSDLSGWHWLAYRRVR